MYTCQGDSDVRDERRRLTRDDVLAEAIDLIDQQGLDALTMRNLADRLGVVPMALYRHVSNKDDLMEGVLDRAVAGVDLPDPGAGNGPPAGGRLDQGDPQVPPRALPRRVGRGRPGEPVRRGADGVLSDAAPFSVGGGGVAPALVETFEAALPRGAVRVRAATLELPAEVRGPVSYTHLTLPTIYPV